jgi:NADH-quinone oxidoreductase subunit H
MMQLWQLALEFLTGPLWFPILMTIGIVGILPLVVGYMTLLERKVLADFQVRLGPMRVGPHGLLQPLADALKMVLKEDTTPAQADRVLFWIAPVFATLIALTAVALLPFSGTFLIADIHVGLLLVTGLGAIGVLAIVMGGWASNSHYPLLGAMRSAAQLVSYEVPMSLALLSPLILSGTMSLPGIVTAQATQQRWFLFANGGAMIIPFVIFLISATAESNRAPFDLPEAESEIVSGYHVEYSGFRFALFMLAEYIHMIVVSMLCVIVFLGGWLAPFPTVTELAWVSSAIIPSATFLCLALGTWSLINKQPVIWQKRAIQVIAVLFAVVGGLVALPQTSTFTAPLFWFLAKVGAIIYLLIWFRATFPRLRYDQLMDLSWKRLTPLALVFLVVNAILAVAWR